MGAREIAINCFKSEDRSKTYKPLIDILPWWCVLITFIIAAILFVIAVLVGVFAGPSVLHYDYIVIDTASNQTEAFLIPLTAQQHYRGIEHYYEVNDGDHPDLKALFYGEDEVIVTSPSYYSTLNQEINFNLYLKSNVSRMVNASSQAFGFQKLDMKFLLHLYGRDAEEDEWTLVVNGTYSRSLTCLQGSELCTSMNLFYETFVRYHHYRIGVSFLNGKELYDNVLIDPHFVKFEIECYNSDYSNWELGWRYSIIFVTLSFCIGFFVACVVRSQFTKWSTEQKWVCLLLLFLILYNNPVFGLIYVGGFAFSFINIVFILSFICFLMFTILVFTDALIQPPKERTFLWFYLPKIVLVGLLWVFVITTFTYVRVQEQNDPGYSLEIVSGLTSYQTLGIIVVLIMIVYIFALVYYLFRAIEKLRMNLLPQRNAWRSKVLWFFTIIMVIGTIVEIFLYVFSKDWNSPGQFLSYFMFYSLYVWVLSFLYWPSWSAVEETEMVQEETTLEKEDEMLYDME